MCPKSILLEPCFANWGMAIFGRDLILVLQLTQVCAMGLLSQSAPMSLLNQFVSRVQRRDQLMLMSLLNQCVLMYTLMYPLLPSLTQSMLMDR